MRPFLIGLVIAVGFAQLPGQAQTPAAPKVQLTFEAGGTVTLVATGATVREILAEWTRKGGTPFIGAEKLTGAPLTVQFEHRPETEVVASLLRNASGYVLGPRSEAPAGVSGLEVVFIVATSSPSAAGSYSAPAAYAPQPQMSTPGSPEYEIPPVGPGRGGQPPAQPDAPPASSRPSGPGGVAVPVVPVVSVPTTTTGPGRGGRGGGGR